MNDIINISGAGTPFDPYWKRVVCYDRTSLTLRGDVREQVLDVVEHCGFKSIRQHGMFHDDMSTGTADLARSCQKCPPGHAHGWPSGAP